jgi:spore germination protein KB
MSIEKGRISGMQLMFLAAGFIQGSVLLISFTVSLTGHDTWLVVLSGLAVFIPFAISYALLGKRFRGMNLVQINDIVYGKYLGKAISVYYIVFFMLTLSFNIRDLGDFYTTFLMTETPLIFFLAVFVSVCAYTVRKGIEVLARNSHLFVLITFVIIISTFLLLLPNMHFSKLLPVLELPLKNFIQGTHIMASIPFGELVIFLMVISALKDTKRAVKNTVLGLIMGGVSILLISVRNTAVLGGTETILASPSFQAVRLIDIGTVFTRMDLLIGIGQTIMAYLKCSLFYYAVVVSLSQLLGLRSYLPLVLPVGAIEVILSAIVFKSSVEHILLTINAGIIYSIPAIYVFAPLSLLIARLRGLPGQEAAKGK